MGRLSVPSVGRSLGFQNRKTPLPLRMVRGEDTPRVRNGEILLWNRPSDNSLTIYAKVNNDLYTATGGASLSDASPQDLGVADAGVSSEASRADHVHPTTGLALTGHTHSLNSAEITDSGDLASDWAWNEGYKINFKTSYGGVNWQIYGEGTVLNAAGYLFSASGSLHSGISVPAIPPDIHDLRYEWNPHVYCGSEAGGNGANFFFYGGIDVGGDNGRGVGLYAINRSDLPTLWFQHPQWQRRLILVREDSMAGDPEYLMFARWDGSNWVEDQIT